MRPSVAQLVNVTMKAHEVVGQGCDPACRALKVAQYKRVTNGRIRARPCAWVFLTARLRVAFFAGNGTLPAFVNTSWRRNISAKISASIVSDLGLYTYPKTGKS